MALWCYSARASEPCFFRTCLDSRPLALFACRTNPRLANSPLAASSYNLTIFNQLNVNDARSQRAWRPNEVDIFEDRSWHNALKEKLSRWTRLAIS